jgi:hypothetical protein
VVASLALHARGRGFNPHIVHQKKVLFCILLRNFLIWNDYEKFVCMIFGSCFVSVWLWDGDFFEYVLLARPPGRQTTGNAANTRIRIMNPRDVVKNIVNPE